ncbi:NADP-dependent 3-hydroxy acid dehydrogenase YdfG [Solirubrobacter pauli]|uniref:NADP-dependent 3-hydroxy acid dehydrogenase YdfG n=1 Tax=Solirubrobacter pauli TaxID=166793 RepID=A0A660LD53_9ACTN|nr:SDR family NAD(P)-dependent oxidoreductase [Solirubrobacter pauli]RKQ92932.1 NADP-dependent 3-hydroxy acid dehydrogenase YdfG [Solirubrobacter pauli]
MSQVIAVFGAGPGLGASVARRFGREGYRVALVARRLAPLEALAAELAEEGIEAAPFSVDLTDQAAALVTLEAIHARFGRIDALYYAPVPEGAFIAARDLRAADIRPLVELLVFTPIELINAVVPELVDRGSGAIVVGHGASAVHPHPGMSGPGVPMAATRNYLHSLNGELADAGVYVGTIAIQAMIAGSAAHAALTSGDLDLGGADFPVVQPADLAEAVWELVTRRDRVELVHP